MFPKIGPMELVIILVIVLVIFGAGKLPEIGSAMGKAIKSFRKETKGGPEETVNAEPTASTKNKKSTKS
ncbi:MAG: twin-arginine translocase TatA/TatE family subunit [Dehalococcoidia bacterium]|nr:twin-arginine translocase TatA/TatE family subunit [Dehalococcoidia bacterium]MDZ4246980.1 twin-arginine translocase TatA/TatE family subunit [Dehalococcoidia bacterium]